MSYGDGLDEARWAAAVRYLRREIKKKDREAIAREIERDGVESFEANHHIPFGMSVRNALRQGGFDEKSLGVLDLDQAWGHLVVEAVAEERARLRS